MGCKASKDLPLEPTMQTEDLRLRVTEATPEERALAHLKVIFDSIDAKSDGSVSKAELTAALDRDTSLSALSLAGLNMSFNVPDSLDTNGEVRVTWGELHFHLQKAAVEEANPTEATAASELPASEKALAQLKTIFDSMKSSDDGSVSKLEFAAALEKDDDLGKLFAEASLNAKLWAFEQLNTHSEGHIAWQDFETHLRTAGTKAVKEDGTVTSAVVLDGTVTSAVVLDRVDVEGPLTPKSTWCSCH